MILERTLNFQGSKGQADLRALFDSGATYSCIRPDVVGGLAQLERLPKPLNVETASAGMVMRVYGCAEFVRGGEHRRDDHAEMEDQTRFRARSDHY